MSTDSPTAPVIDPSPFSLELYVHASMSRLPSICLTVCWRFLRNKANLPILWWSVFPVPMKCRPGFLSLQKVVAFQPDRIGRGHQGVNLHHHLVAESAGHAIQNLVIQHRLPIINGIVVTDDLTTAEERITGNLDRGSNLPMLHWKWQASDKDGPRSNR